MTAKHRASRRSTRSSRTTATSRPRCASSSTSWSTASPRSLIGTSLPERCYRARQWSIFVPTPRIGMTRVAGARVGCVSNGFGSQSTLVEDLTRDISVKKSSGRVTAVKDLFSVVGAMVLVLAVSFSAGGNGAAAQSFEGTVLSSGFAKIPVRGATVQLVPTDLVDMTRITGRSIVDPPFPTTRRL